MNANALPQLLKEYRTTYNVTQEQLSVDLSVEVRTIRRWELGETILRDKEELRRIASLLGVNAERLGVVSTFLQQDQTRETLEHIWFLVDNGRAYEGRAIASRLATDVKTIATHTGDIADLRTLALAQHAQAYTTAMNTRPNEIHQPLRCYHQMEETARLVDDPVLLALALTYQGDMYTRVGKIDKSLPYLREALNSILSDDVATRGNALQLLARAYFKEDNIEEFELAMKRAEEDAYALQEEGITRGQYGLISVYEEYAKSYALMGRMQDSLDFIEKAYALGTPDTHWNMVLKTAKAMALVRGGEIQVGTDLAIECVAECRKYGTIRLLERIYSVNRYLHQ